MNSSEKNRLRGVGCLVLLGLIAWVFVPWGAVIPGRTVVLTTQLTAGDRWKLVFSDSPWDAKVEIRRLDGTFAVTLSTEFPPPASRDDTTWVTMRADERGLVWPTGRGIDLARFSTQIALHNWLMSDADAPVFGLVCSVVPSHQSPETGRLIRVFKNPLGGPDRPVSKVGVVRVPKGEALYIAYNQVVSGFWSENWRPVTGGSIDYSFTVLPRSLFVALSGVTADDFQERRQPNDGRDSLGSMTEANGGGIPTIPEQPRPEPDPGLVPGSDVSRERFGLRFVWVPSRSLRDTGFWIGATEVTSGALCQWLEGERYRWDRGREELDSVAGQEGAWAAHVGRLGLGGVGCDKPTLPVELSYQIAACFCSEMGGHLPSPSEWEWAASGGEPSRKYPWGNEPLSRSRLWYAANGPTEVAQYPPNLFGLFDSAGNVAEWCLFGDEHRRVAEVRGGGYRMNRSEDFAVFAVNDHVQLRQVPTSFGWFTRYEGSLNRPDYSPTFLNTQQRYGFRCVIDGGPSEAP